MFFLGVMVCNANVSAQPDVSLISGDRKDKGILNHMDVSVTAGSTGLGVDFAMPLGEYVKVRAGGTWMPHFRVGVQYELLMLQ